jgi:hypothetical protein
MNLVPKKVSKAMGVSERGVTDSPTCGLGIWLGGAALAHTGLSFVPSGPALSLFLL